MKPEQVHGAWNLISFEIENPEGQRSPWGKNTHGLLLYSASGHMSVSINKDFESSDEGESADTLDSILFYSGTYVVEGDVIRHQVTEASNPKRIGKEMIRHAQLKGDALDLTTPIESFGRAILVWKKVGI